MTASIQSSQGSVTLVGAGPGDPELLTLKAVRAIAGATVILVDDLVSDAVLAHASPEARIIYVGKRGGCTSTSQAYIEQLMLSECQQGQTVVRLKGGDPMMFGRAGEEIAVLTAAGIPCTVVSGITASLAAAAGQGISLTHRNHAHGVVFITGHVAPHGSTLDWTALGLALQQLKLTLVVYMGARHADLIQQGLQVHCAAATPVSLVQHASTEQERHVLTRLDQLNHTIQTQALHSPLIMIIGDVVKLTFACKAKQ